jgi:hypothetical protein
MDFENYWQENRKALIAIGCGLLVFLIANTIVDGTFGQDLGEALRERRNAQSDLKKSRYDSAALGLASDDNDTLLAARDGLSKAVVFQARPEFLARPELGSISGQYFTRVEQVRERLGRLASRAGLRAPDDAWGIVMPQTHAAPTIERHFEALDLIDRVVRASIDAGVRRISRIQVRLDPGFGSRKGLGRIERTRVLFSFDTSAASMSTVMLLTQSSEPYGQALAIEDFEIKGERNREGHVKADVTFTIVRLAESTEDGEIDG